MKYKGNYVSLANIPDISYIFLGRVNFIPSDRNEEREKGKSWTLLSITESLILFTLSPERETISGDCRHLINHAQAPLSVSYTEADESRRLLSRR